MPHYRRSPTVVIPSLAICILVIITPAHGAALKQNAYLPEQYYPSSFAEGLADSLRRNHYQQQAPLPNYNVQLLPFQFAKPRVSENLPDQVSKRGRFDSLIAQLLARVGHKGEGRPALLRFGASG